MTAFRSYLTAADDAQRMLLWCILHDAMEGQYAAEEDCSVCQAGGRAACLCHWDAHEASASGYRELQMQFEHYIGRTCGFPLTAQAQRVILAALEGAIAFRGRGKTAEDRALKAAYQMLRCDLAPATSRGVASRMSAARSVARARGRAAG